MCLVVVPDRYDRVWHLAEMCAECAAATRRSKIVAGAKKPTPPGPRPPEAGGAVVPGQSTSLFSNVSRAEAPPMAAPKQRRTAPARTAPTAAPARASAKAPHASQSPAETGGKKKLLLTPSGKVLLSTTHADCLRHVWTYLASHRPGSTPEARLLAFVCTLRAASSGTASLTAQDISGMKLKDPGAALRDLTGSGWLAGTTPDEVLQAGSTPVACDVPSLQTTTAGLAGVTKSARPRLSGWAQRLFSHKRLRKHSPEARLLAAYTSSFATQVGEGRVRVAEAAAITCVSQGALTSVVDSLTQADWYVEAKIEDEWLVCRLDDEVVGFAPGGGRPPEPPTSRLRGTGGRLCSVSGRRATGRDGEDERVAEARRILGPAFSLDIERAMTCTACAADGIAHDAPPPYAAPRAVSYNQLGQRESLTGRQAGVVQALLTRVAESAPPSTADVRLAAMWWAARAMETGECALSAPKLERIPVPDATSALRALTAARWINVDVSVVLAASDLEPVHAAIPAFGGDEGRLHVGKDAAGHIRGWLWRLLTYRRLDHSPSSVKLAALYATAHSHPCGLVEGEVKELAEIAVLDSVDEAHAMARQLTRAGWLDDFRITDDGALTARMSAHAVRFAAATQIFQGPRDFAPVALEVNDKALALIRGRERDIAGWVAAYRDAHRHGPKWKTIFKGCFGLPDDAFDSAVERAVHFLFQDGWLAGRGFPHGTRPGRRFHEADRAQVETGTGIQPGKGA
ncbi:hypothetical protein [Streptomyces sp. TRM64462]|uniref:hypothetical protein n=1 Tax=Streptomyces sp. TRM64462 TaxID=2741726 RepID=UPI00158608CF|nr:hypothetical protein [Streptomyces sp. TRM64462]